MSIQSGQIWQSKHVPDRLVEVRDVFGPMVTVVNGTGREKVLRASELCATYVNLDGYPAAASPANGTAEQTPVEAGAGVRTLLGHIARARGPGSITTVHVLVGRALAEELLANNPTNRGVRREHVDNLARDMVSGRWRRSHSG